MTLTDVITATSSEIVADQAAKIFVMHQCDKSSSIYLRNKCHDCFVIVKLEIRVLEQHEEGIAKFCA